jgi:uncharacterized repeat protein (TIGR03987 family)
MKPILIAGTIIVNLALVFYTIGILSEQLRRVVNRRVLTFLTLGVIFDITATACMIIGSSSDPFTLHGILGYSSLAGMLIETVLAWKHYLSRADQPVPRSLHLYSRLAYIWWVLAYITGAALVFLARG